MAKKVFVNGYGSIGKRIAAFISEDPEIDLIGVGKYSNDAGVSDAKSKGHNVYVPEKKLGDFENAISGSIESALAQCDLVIDACLEAPECLQRMCKCRKRMMMQTQYPAFWCRC